MFVHRKLADGDVYFVDNRIGSRGRLSTRHFALTEKPLSCGMQPAERMQSASYSIANDSTTVPLRSRTVGHVPSLSSASRPKQFLVRCQRRKKPLSRKSTTRSTTTGRSASSLIAALRRQRPSTGSSRGVIRADYGIKYFSGSASYCEDGRASSQRLRSGCAFVARSGRRREYRGSHRERQEPGHRVEDAVPYRRDESAHAGQQPNPVKVTNLWVNRLIGDQQPWSLKKYAFAISRLTKPTRRFCLRVCSVPSTCCSPQRRNPKPRNRACITERKSARIALRHSQNSAATTRPQ